MYGHLLFNQDKIFNNNIIIMHFQPITPRSQRLGTQVALPTWFIDSATMNTRLKCTCLNCVLIPERSLYASSITKPTCIAIYVGEIMM